MNFTTATLVSAYIHLKEKDNAACNIQYTTYFSLSPLLVHVLILNIGPILYCVGTTFKTTKYYIKKIYKYWI